MSMICVTAHDIGYHYQYGCDLCELKSKVRYKKGFMKPVGVQQ